MTEAPPQPRPGSCAELFLAFSVLALQGFGGVLAVAQRELCERKRWLSQAEFLELIALGQLLPGPNVCNLSLMVGDRFLGTRGALAALAGMVTAPLVIALAAMALYTRLAEHSVVMGALHGMGAVAAGLILGTALKLATSLHASALGRPLATSLGLAAFVAVAWARLPLAAVLLCLGPLACGLAWRRLPEEPS